MKKLVVFVLLLQMSFLFSSCVHSHTWEEATCIKPRTCSICGKAEGQPLGHDWKSATCTSPKTCSRCGLTEGNTISHDWEESEIIPPTCDNSGYSILVCSLCGETKKANQTGRLGHEWAFATCTSPKTCSRCGTTAGSPLGHQETSDSCTNEWTCSRCGETFSALGHDWKDATCTAPRTCSRCGAVDGAALGHRASSPVTENKKTATCTEAGQYDEVIYCSVCREELSRETKTENALGHTVTSGVCSRCGLEVYEPIVGRGDDVISGVSVGDGLYRAHITNSGSHNFIVWIHDKYEDRDLAVNTIGNYDGYCYLEGASPFIFEIESHGNWTVTVEKIATTTKTSFHGTGDYVTDMFSAESGTWHITYNGSHNFVVWLLTTDGRRLIVNEIGAYDGKKLLSIPSGSNAVLIVEASGEWSIEPSN